MSTIQRYMPQITFGLILFLIGAVLFSVTVAPTFAQSVVKLLSGVGSGPTISLASNTLVIGQDVQLTGTGFIPNQGVQICFFSGTTVRLYTYSAGTGTYGGLGYNANGSAYTLPYTTATQVATTSTQPVGSAGKCWNPNELLPGISVQSYYADSNGNLNAFVQAASLTQPTGTCCFTPTPLGPGMVVAYTYANIGGAWNIGAQSNILQVNIVANTQIPSITVNGASGTVSVTAPPGPGVSYVTIAGTGFIPLQSVILWRTTPGFSSDTSTCSIKPSGSSGTMTCGLGAGRTDGNGGFSYSLAISPICSGCSGGAALIQFQYSAQSWDQSSQTGNWLSPMSNTVTMNLVPANTKPNTPSISLPSTQLTATQTAQITGSGFTPNANTQVCGDMLVSGTIYVQCEPGPTADGSGNISGAFLVSGYYPQSGPVTVYAYDQTSGGKSNTVPATVNNPNIQTSTATFTQSSQTITISSTSTGPSTTTIISSTTTLSSGPVTQTFYSQSVATQTATYTYASSVTTNQYGTSTLYQTTTQTQTVGSTTTSTGAVQGALQSSVGVGSILLMAVGAITAILPFGRKH